MNNQKIKFVDAQFGNPEAMAAVKTWREAAEADGWELERISAHEDVTRWCRAKKEGFVAQLLCREPEAKGQKSWANISLWGPDGLAILAPVPYDWSLIQAGVRHCNICNADDVDTTRYSFAGRCCVPCLPQARATHEKPGWCD